MVAQQETDCNNDIAEVIPIGVEDFNALYMYVSNVEATSYRDAGIPLVN